jgi:adenylate cyclase
MRITYSFQGQEATFDHPLTAVVLGRPKPGVLVDLDLSPDKTVSRPHARITLENDRWWIEDLDSGSGTLVNGEEIKGEEKVPLAIGSHLRMGETDLQFEPAPKGLSGIVSDTQKATVKAPGPVLRRFDPNATKMNDFIRKVNISPVMPAGAPLASDTLPIDESPAVRQQRLLYELMIEFGADAPLDQMLQRAVERLVATIPAAERGALLIREPVTGQLLLKAHLPSGQPSVSSSLAEYSMNCHGGFIWKRNPEMSAIQIENQMASGMYAPLLWKEEMFGVVCVDNCDSLQTFDNDDLELLVTAAQHIALTIANYNLSEGVRQNASLVERLLTNFSPAVRRRLLDKARHGRLRLGGEKSEVTILASDIRGFTQITSSMDAEDVVDMLNAYFSAQVQSVFHFEGTIDKFIGDGILAVFGSPEPDDDQHAKAVRAAMAIQEALVELTAKRKAMRLPTCEVGIAIHCGKVLHGFIGSEERMEFTLIGDAVNRAARFCAAAGAGEVLISPELHQRVWKIVQTEPTTVTTKHEGNWPAFRVLKCIEKPGPVAVNHDSVEIRLPQKTPKQPLG